MSAKYTIHVDGVAYGGIDPYGEDNTPPEAVGDTFHNYKSAIGRDALIWGGEPYVIESNINLKSHLDRILTRIRDGSIDAWGIVIQRVGA